MCGCVLTDFPKTKSAIIIFPLYLKMAEMCFTWSCKCRKPQKTAISRALKLDPGLEKNEKWVFEKNANTIIIYKSSV